MEKWAGDHTEHQGTSFIIKDISCKIISSQNIILQEDACTILIFQG